MYGQHSQQQGPPQPPYPWRVEWDGQDQRWFFINTQTGERSWDFPGQQRPHQQQGGYSSGYSGQGQGQNYAQQQQQQQQAPQKNHNMAYGAAGLAAGVLGGALLMHEGEKVEHRWDEDKARLESSARRDEYRAESDFDAAADDAADFPDNAARWAGRRVQDVEDIPDDVEHGFDRVGDRVEQGWDNAVDGIEDAPDRLANWVGDGIGKVERFGDGVEQSYDDGRGEGRGDGW